MSTPTIPAADPDVAEQIDTKAAKGQGTLAVRRGGWFVRITIIVIVVLWLIPTIGVLVTSFRPEAAADSSGWWNSLLHPFRAGEWTLENYRLALTEREGFGNAFMNSLAVTIPSTVIPITIAAFAAYAFSWMEFRGRYILFVGVVAMLVVPLQMALIPILRLYNDGGQIGRLIVFPDLDLVGEFLGVWLAHTAFGLPLAIYLLRNYIGSLPASIIESAKIDGADHFTIFWKLIVPLSVPALAAFAIFQFLWVWNDLLVAYVFLGGTRENQVLTMALQNLVGARGENWHLLTAAAFISMMLPLLVFFSLQRYFVRGLTAGSVKG
jgi:alpha-glucoside transport system permease protein